MTRVSILKRPVENPTQIMKTGIHQKQKRKQKTSTHQGTSEQKRQAEDKTNKNIPESKTQVL